ncbi:protein-glutamate O-methyltransferase CheR [Alcanivorax sp. JB21]|uniref:CheR family methyltransferase n=1 Tax=Alcanivorax limicola TaxID=2874102 RepID=UPI001CC1AC0E|nr:CheR family methyltransferase [Alcanivorax limicola]MBZ2188887.1 protein-glutamate O-methyltransferase CheR [Alcanivorax limicola]
MRPSPAVTNVTNSWSIRSTPEMSSEQFELWKTLLEERTGMTLHPERKPFLENSLAVRMRELALDDYDHYYQQLVAGSTGAKAMEWSVLVDRLTVQETSFFRHPGSYALVEEYVQRFIDERPPKSSLDVWSVGCSTGEEPYSLAMVISEQFQARKSSDYYGITATDISLPTLAKARKAIYGSRKVERIDPALRERYFRQLNEREYQVQDALRDRVCFARLNVLDLQQAPIRDMDIIFCQNMLIYFRRWRKRQIVTRLAEKLAPGGMLVLGAGEITDWHHPDLERVHFADALAFRRCR